MKANNEDAATAGVQTILLVGLSGFEARVVSVRLNGKGNDAEAARCFGGGDPGDQ